MTELEQRVATLEAIITGLLDEVCELKSKEHAREQFAAQQRKVEQAKLALLGGFGAFDQQSAQAQAQMSAASQGAFGQAQASLEFSKKQFAANIRRGNSLEDQLVNIGLLGLGK